MAIHAVFPDTYDQQLDAKAARLRRQFAAFEPPALEVFCSQATHYRQRAEFKIWQAQGRAHYAMYKPGEYKQPFIIEDFKVGAPLINDLMPPLLTALNASEILRRRLFQVEFLTTLSGAALVTLIYHKALDEHWTAAAEKLRRQLAIDIIGRSRKQKVVLGKDYVIECLNLGERKYYYQQVEGCFTQPNAGVCEKMLAWACDATQPLDGDLLELYCGNGNFTLPLARQFDRVLATEISKTSVKSALYNLDRNGIDNVAIARMSSEEFAQAMDKVRAFRRLQDIALDGYRFSTVLVDPPRAGLDPHTVDIVKRFDNILYISCNPETLQQNLQSISATHHVQRFALFDQFPYTDHIECGVLLRRRDA
ncbi:tRNA (uridine(54)-C5)-methyltransferase TrmA [Exilibacterium tricleocarpae]|uniref:tRNA/tmRNA (uracil-C(5))-methyltransferase n=1 Tax=Exilibacterium tricleocarpae TaxID=2591008 RepID=A0A545T8A3_9GAMM|nr:tRNA (uridine(54)-C5)-methyltransferase TrmA [Exilibacterium tricleocarpae]TQV73453.1 tRNA (uridine(54)-C5)-methyltransferase TrmA [Exilibacterium tricleocarpae]